RRYPCWRTLHLYKVAGAQGLPGAIWHRAGAPLSPWAGHGIFGQAAARGSVQMTTAYVCNSGMDVTKRSKRKPSLKGRSSHFETKSTGISNSDEALSIG